jgi:hypothetical protein
MRRIVSRLAVESQHTAAKTQEVAFERRRVDRLLNEMMPPSISAQLKV